MASAFEGSITFFYYDDLEGASRFYEEVMGFEPVIELDFARVYQVCENVHLGLVDGRRGMLKPSIDKPVMLSLFVEDVDAWYRKLKNLGIDVEPPREPEYLKMRVMLFKDPEGYTLELLQWLKKPYGR